MLIAGARSQMQYIFYFKATLKLFKQMCSLFTYRTGFLNPLKTKKKKKNTKRCSPLHQRSLTRYMLLGEKPKPCNVYWAAALCVCLLNLLLNSILTLQPPPLHVQLSEHAAGFLQSRPPADLVQAAPSSSWVQQDPSATRSIHGCPITATLPASAPRPHFTCHFQRHLISVSAALPAGHRLWHKQNQGVLKA